jgi:hypothetical protein
MVVKYYISLRTPLPASQSCGAFSEDSAKLKSALSYKNSANNQNSSTLSIMKILEKSNEL